MFVEEGDAVKAGQPVMMKNTMGRACPFGFEMCYEPMGPLYTV